MATGWSCSAPRGSGDAAEPPESTAVKTSLRQRLFARLMAGMDETSDAIYRERKTALLAPLRGTVVEIGPGTGVNLRFLDPSVHWIGLEPNREMHPHLRERARQLDREIDLRGALLGDAGLEAASVDAVISTLVLCSVPSVSALLAEILAVLRPGGSFVFLEHVVDRPGTIRRWVQRAAPWTPWRFFSDGCDPGREIGAEIRAAGFSRVEFESYLQAGPGLVLAVNRPHICGKALR